MYFNEVEFGNRIRNLRKSRGITQERLAEELNISYESLRKIENGTRSASYGVLLDISKYFCVSTDYLLSGNEYTYYEMKRCLESAVRDLTEIHNSIIPA